MQPGKGIQIF